MSEYLKRSRVQGDKKRPAERLTMHWIDSPRRYMHWCNCMPAFRVGAEVHHPADTKGVGLARIKRRRKENGNVSTTVSQGSGTAPTGTASGVQSDPGA